MTRAEQAARDAASLQRYVLWFTKTRRLDDPYALSSLEQGIDCWDVSFGRGSVRPGRAYATVKARILKARHRAEIRAAKAASVSAPDVLRAACVEAE